MKLPRMGRLKLPRLKTESKVPRAALEWAGYGAFFLGCFVISVLLTFPYERLRNYAVARVAAMNEPGESPLRLEIEDLGPAWPPGIELNGVTLKRDAEVKGGVPLALTLDEVEVHPALFAAIFGNLRMSFEVESGDGSVEGDFAMGDTGWSIDAELDELDLDAMGLGGFLGAPLRGLASGQVQFEMGAEPVNDEGMIEATIEGLKIGDGKAKVALPGLSQGLTVEPIDAGRLEAAIPIKQGVAAFDKLQASGKDLELRASGSVRLMHPLPLSRADLTLEVDFKDAYRNRSDRTKTMFQLMSAQPVVRQATTSTGAMRFSLRGPLGAMHGRPAGTPGKASPAGGRADRRNRPSRRFAKQGKEDD